MSEEIIPLAWWQALVAVVDYGGYAPAAEHLGKSQSAVSYSIQRLEEQLGVQVFRLQGRRAALTGNGQILLQRARRLLEHAHDLQASARELVAGREPLLRVAVDSLFPDWLLLQAMAQFSSASPGTRIEVQETVLSGSDDALLKREADLAITPRIPQGFIGEPLLLVRQIAVAAPEHPLNNLGRTAEWADLRAHRQLVLRDSGSQRQSAGWLEAGQRWTFSNLASSIQAAVAGLGFAWLPSERIRTELAAGRLQALNLQEGQTRYITLYRVFARSDFPGVACRELTTMLQRLTSQHFPFQAPARHDSLSAPGHPPPPRESP